MHPHLFNGPVLTIYHYSKCEKNKQGQYFFLFFQTQHQKLLSDLAVR